MPGIEILPPEEYGYGFIPPAFLPPGKDEYWLRNAAAGAKNWRTLAGDEIEALEKNGCVSSNWAHVLVCDPFDPSLIRNSQFYGLVRLGTLRNVILKHHDFRAASGIRNSVIVSSDIGDDSAIQDCSSISHYIIGDNCILSRIGEMQTTNHAKFGNGVIKDGEDEDVRIWIDVMNEAGGRSILPFEDMIPADAFLWAAYRDDGEMTGALKAITQKRWGGSRGAYGRVGKGTVIKSCAIIKDTAIGDCAYIKGANKLKNLSVLSSEEEPSQIGEGVEMVNGIVGYGCHAFYGSKAVRFVMGRNCNLKYGARLIHSVLGDNSTVSCCEILNNLIFPVHEQHHNNSFLIASLFEGMSNMAAAATIGSNHNSRANDGEIRAGRGFWPGLAVSIKHSSRFASFVLIAKGEYPSELNIPFPFSLVNNNVHKNRLEVMPAYFWLHNLYALERNSWKAAHRDRRKKKIQAIETGYLAPDTAEEIVKAVSLLEALLAEAGHPPYSLGISHNVMAHNGDDNLDEPRIIPARDLERGKRGEVIIKPRRALAAYRQMLAFYAAKTIAAFFDSRPDLDFAGLAAFLGAPDREARVKDWVNMGGQICPAFRIDALRGDIRGGRLADWDAIHRVYGDWRSGYPLDKARHAWALLGTADREGVRKKFEEALETRRFISAQVFETRAKDFRNPMKRATFRNQAEMEAVLGKPGGSSFEQICREEERDFAELIERILARR
jgi:NDP-sugar pyrophosphorylase family protein